MAVHCHFCHLLRRSRIQARFYWPPIVAIPSAKRETSGGCAALFRLSDNTPWCALKRASAVNLFTLSV
ncbi:hypothetical protein L5L78_17525 [Shewanella sp. SM34]|uniref:hypothetical protein n=1 Tax=unclassified Shewanella TaxID=196818 RepID=UPI0021D94FBC|nr:MULTISPECIES: hypothetical protein [unclassified Shewanella]MCU8058070.1 hypothetical protein [Shewanella sp. SM35]MCU8066900.1 hypothetical protein [Shewanella sp. SM34]